MSCWDFIYINSTLIIKYCDTFSLGFWNSKNNLLYYYCKNPKINSQPKYIPAEATRTVKIIAKLTLMNHFRSVHPARVFRIRILESVPDVDEDLENKFCSALPHKYWKIKINKSLAKNVTSLEHFVGQEVRNLDMWNYTTKYI